MTTATQAIDPERLRKLDAWWRAANDLSVGQIYLYENPLLQEPLTLAHIKPRLLGHWASNDQGDVPTLETLAAVALTRAQVPDLKIRVINVVDLMKLQPPGEHPHALIDREFDRLFTTDKPIIFAYHGAIPG